MDSMNWEIVKDETVTNKREDDSTMDALIEEMIDLYLLSSKYVLLSAKEVKAVQSALTSPFILLVLENMPRTLRASFIKAIVETAVDTLRLTND